MKRATAAFAALLLLLAACSSSGGGKKKNSGSPAKSSGSSAPSGSTVNVYAAASLTEAFTTLKTQFEKAHPGSTVKLKFGASSELSTQITQGAPADVFAAASLKNTDTLVRAGVATDALPFASNTLEIAVPPSNPGKVTSVRDLADKGVKVAVCDPAVPCGAVAAKVFVKAKITVKPVSNQPDVKSTLAVVESGEVDAGLVYVTDVRAAGSKVKGLPIPASINASTEYGIVALKKTQNSTLAKAFVTLVTSAAGQQVLKADGFGGS